MSDNVYFSTASFYDCPTGSGACGACAGGWEAAWPNVQGHPPNYAQACLQNIDLIPCNHFVIVDNLCHAQYPGGFYMGVKIVDHGPNPRLVCGIDHPVCYPGAGFNRFIDLTRKTYIDIGGNLAQGLIACYIYVTL